MSFDKTIIPSEIYGAINAWSHIEYTAQAGNLELKPRERLDVQPTHAVEVQGDISPEASDESITRRLFRRT